MQAQYRTMLKRRNLYLAIELGIRPDQADRLLDLLADQYLRTLGQQGASASPNAGSLDAPAAPGPMPSPPDMQKREQAYEQEITALIGQRKLREWQYYLATSEARQERDVWRDHLAGEGVPLRGAQMRPFLQALVREEQRASEQVHGAMKETGFTGEVGEFTRRMPPPLQLRLVHDSHRRLLRSLATILTPAQVRSVRRQLEQGAKTDRLQLLADRAEAGLGGAARVSPR